MDASGERRRQDLLKLHALGKLTDGRVKVVSTAGNPLNEVVVELDYPTASSGDYPARVQRPTRVKIELSAAYPFKEPTATITTPIYHPNVYSSGRICFGPKWLPTENLALLVRRIVQIITFDPTILNERSPANSQALQWYRSAYRVRPTAFPTTHVIIRDEPEPVKKMEWRETTPQPPSLEKAIVTCCACGGKLRVDAGGSGRIKCPTCTTVFEVRT
jgi:Ubiquitin-conjugating enzyme